LLADRRPLYILALALGFVIKATTTAAPDRADRAEVAMGRAVQATMATGGLMRLCCFLSAVLLLSFIVHSALAEERFYEFVVSVHAPSSDTCSCCFCNRSSLVPES
jgi:hypothetical protein